MAIKRRRVSNTDRLLTIGQIIMSALGLISWFVPNITLSQKTIATLGTVTAITTAAAVRMMIRNQRLERLLKAQPATESSNSLGATVTMDEALRHILSLNPTKLRVLAYVGNNVEAALRSQAIPHGLELYLLVRNPATEWIFPLHGSRTEKSRKRDILRNKERLLTHPIFKNLAHRLTHSPTSSFLRYYGCEPICHAAVADYGDRSRRMYFGFYSIVDFGAEKDYGASKKPVVEVNPLTKGGEALLEAFVAWFDHYWADVAEKS